MIAIPNKENDMGVYINKEELLKELSVIQDRPVHSAMQIIKVLPTIDIVRCEECIYHDDGLCHRPKWSLAVEPTDFCSYGERRNDEHNTGRD